MDATAFHSVIMVFRKATAFPLWWAIERRWNRKVVSSVTVVMRLSISCVSSISISSHLISSYYYYYYCYAGNDIIHRLTTLGGRQILRIELKLNGGDYGVRYAEYDNFRVESGKTNYLLSSVGNYRGNAGQYMLWQKIYNSCLWVTLCELCERSLSAFRPSLLHSAYFLARDSIIL